MVGRREYANPSIRGINIQKYSLFYSRIRGEINLGGFAEVSLPRERIRAVAGEICGKLKLVAANSRIPVSGNLYMLKYSLLFVLKFVITFKRYGRNGICLYS
jgi:hypothetical protein